MTIDEQIVLFSKELQNLGGEMCRADIIRRMQQIKRMTAEQCAASVRDHMAGATLDYMMNNLKPNIINKISNDILNDFLS